ncbi:hypothetical protein A9D14_18660 (plasmid) [Croceicoccus marinus]|uniref:PD(D/E)XK endonuclease domain-containing protein n=2 Tax=Croceicoccus marinus TaxID=450378 RepID=A0A217EZ04_9SPHN|nr:hypothetical protein A9D14_18660 [Croceicoccus marinus]
MSRYRSQVREAINRNTVISLALEQDFNAFLPVYDGGVDFILYRESDGVIRKVQLKSRWTIDRNYVGRDIWIAFPHSDDWYLMPHDEMVAQAEAEGITKTASWIDGGACSKPRPTLETIGSWWTWRMAEIAGVADAAAAQAPDK